MPAVASLRLLGLIMRARFRRGAVSAAGLSMPASRAHGASISRHFSDIFDCAFSEYRGLTPNKAIGHRLSISQPSRRFITQQHKAQASPESDFCAHMPAAVIGAARHSAASREAGASGFANLAAALLCRCHVIPRDSFILRRYDSRHLYGQL